MISSIQYGPPSNPSLVYRVIHYDTHNPPSYRHALATLFAYRYRTRYRYRIQLFPVGRAALFSYIPCLSRGSRAF